MNRSKGFTLVEIAIVLVIIGLLLGGILKGQELINNARVRAIADRSNSLKAAWFAFIDRYSALPGDYAQALRYVPNAASNGAGNGRLADTDSTLVFNHLTGAGLLRCTVCSDGSGTTPSAQNSPLNLYGGVMAIFSNSNSYMVAGGPNKRARLQALTGPRMPSNIITEVDRKIDDGLPHKGDFVFVPWDATLGVAIGSTSKRNNTAHSNTSGCITTLNSAIGTAASAGVTIVDNAAGLAPLNNVTWRDVRANPPTVNDCGGGSFF